MKTQPQFKFSKEELSAIRQTIQAYFLDELDIEIGDLQADLFIEFLNTQIGREYYNLGVRDVIAAIKDKTDDLVLLIKD
jgi:uncharacterized protein (DUF2164 family)